MRVENLETLGANASIDADLVIIGGGPAAYDRARILWDLNARSDLGKRPTDGESARNGRAADVLNLAPNCCNSGL
jgi:hypothetical protein